MLSQLVTGPAFCHDKISTNFKRKSRGRVYANAVVSSLPQYLKPGFNLSLERAAYQGCMRRSERGEKTLLGRAGQRKNKCRMEMTTAGCKKDNSRMQQMQHEWQQQCLLRSSSDCEEESEIAAEDQKT
eukprot:757196-Hanusia_phi.AAC.1